MLGFTTHAISLHMMQVTCRHACATALYSFQDESLLATGAACEQKKPLQETRGAGCHIPTLLGRVLLGIYIYDADLQSHVPA